MVLVLDRTSATSGSKIDQADKPRPSAPARRAGPAHPVPMVRVASRRETPLPPLPEALDTAPAEAAVQRAEVATRRLVPSATAWSLAFVTLVLLLGGLGTMTH